MSSEVPMDRFIKMKDGWNIKGNDLRLTLNVKIYGDSLLKKRSVIERTNMTEVHT